MTITYFKDRQKYANFTLFATILRPHTRVLIAVKREEKISKLQSQIN
jgi:hypothetical protein